MDVDLLRVADACACSVNVATSKTEHVSAGLGVLAARMLRRSEVFGSFCGTLVYHSLSSREHTKKAYRDRALKVDVSRFSEYALRVKVPGRRFERTTERIEHKKAICMVLVPLFSFDIVNEFRYAKEYEG